MEYHQVRRVAGGELQGLAASACTVHLVLADTQVDPQRPQDLRFIVDHEDGCHRTTIARVAAVHARGVFLTVWGGYTGGSAPCVARSPPCVGIQWGGAHRVWGSTGDGGPRWGGITGGRRPPWAGEGAIARGYTRAEAPARWDLLGRRARDCHDAE